MITRILACILMLAIIGCASKKSEEPDPIYHLVENGIQFKAYTKIRNPAFARAAYVVGQMLKNSSDIKKRMVDSGFTIDIIGKNQKISDLPRYQDLKGRKTMDGRTFDDGTRGVGGHDACSVGEENLLCDHEQMYWEENILVHELAHSIKFHMTKEMSEKVDQAYLNAKNKKLYPQNIYMMVDSHEYWAEATQSWFHATVRRDVNAGINTRIKILEHDPEISSILKQVYGDTTISHSKNCVY